MVELVDAIPRGEGRSGGDRDFKALYAKVWSEQSAQTGTSPIILLVSVKTKTIVGCRMHKPQAVGGGTGLR